MKVLWLSVNPAKFEERTSGSWIGALQEIIAQHCPEIELGITFEYGSAPFKIERDGVTYYPIQNGNSRWDRLRLKLSPRYEWKLLKPRLEKVVNDFRPDVIHCFGSEYAYGYLQQAIPQIPVIVHMQGFLNIYNASEMQALRVSDYYKMFHYNPLQMLHFRFRYNKNHVKDTMEREIMQLNHYFMGRTEWDRNIVRYYHPEAEYFHCPEAIRKAIKESPVRWKFQPTKTMHIVSISSASALKGNGIILQTARFLKEQGFDFHWRVAGDIHTFRLFESITGISHQDVNIELIGFINATTVAKELAEAEVYVHAAIIDNSPNSLCEAQLIGCPVVSAFVGGIPQLVEDGKSGIFYPYNEFHTLAFTLMNLHNDREKLEALSTYEIERSHLRHDETGIANRLTEIYRAVSSKHTI